MDTSLGLHGVGASALLALVIALVMIQIKPADLAGIDPVVMSADTSGHISW